MQCRTALRAREACDWVTHRVVDLDSADGRRELLGWVWGQPAPAAAIGLSVRALLDAVAAYRRPRIQGRRSRVARRRRAPLSAVAQPPRFHSGAPIIGEIASGDTAPSPLTLRGSVGYGIVGQNERAEPTEVVVRDAYARQLTIAAVDGREIVVPAGRIDLVGAERGEKVAPGPALVAYAAGLDTLYDPWDEDPLALTCAREIALQVGDRVALRNELRMRPDPRRGEAETAAPAYREAARMILSPVGTPCLERLRGANT